MQNMLGKSLIRRKIILLLVYNSEKEFFLSEIARQVKTSPGTAQRELNRLRTMDLISFQKRGNLSIYRLNKRFPLLKEIEAIVRKTIGIEHEHGQALLKVNGLTFAFIFGSYAEDGLRSLSDIDLLLIGTPDEDEVYRAVSAVEDLIKKDINYHILTEAEFALKAKKKTFVRNAAAKPLMLLGKEHDLRKLAGQA
ncbi:MAG: nucleotidyltransferase domain-containing protein [Candidatus Aminicenantes bacterium]|nr:nucleotidyltransferase domain-containing protein [Candidatus Aminicenantes bacterium]